MLTPHQPKGDEIVHDFLAEAGFEIVRLVGLKCASPFAIAEVTATTLMQVLRDIDGNDIDAILQVGTNLANAAVAAEAERWLGKPVLAMNVVTYWDGESGRLTKSETFQDHWTRVGAWDLPASHTASTASDGGMSIRTVSFSGHTLVKKP